MLKIFGSIKRIQGPFMVSMVSFASFSPGFSAHAQTSAVLPAPAAPVSSLTFLATARLKSPDRMYEASTAEIRVNLDGSRSVVLTGRGLNVTLQSEPNPFSNAQLVRVSATGDVGKRGESASFSAGSFKIKNTGEHSFMFVERSRGWLLELRLRPLQDTRPSPLQPPVKKSPAREQWPKKPKRLPA